MYTTRVNKTDESNIGVMFGLGKVIIEMLKVDSIHFNVALKYENR